jgi:hypothetical protein
LTSSASGPGKLIGQIVHYIILATTIIGFFIALAFIFMNKPKPGFMSVFIKTVVCYEFLQKIVLLKFNFGPNLTIFLEYLLKIDYY